MKPTTILALTLAALATPLWAQMCNQRLMESYDITGQAQVVKDGNTICSGITLNCCSPQAQLDIYKRWKIRNAKGRISSAYQSAKSIMSRVLQAMAKVEATAIKSIPYTSDIQNSNCRKMALRIKDISVSNSSEKIMSKMALAISFLTNSRQGFYCSLCDANTHQYYNGTNFKFRTSAQFCGKLAQNLLSYYIFKYKFFPKIARLYAQWTVSCDINGNFKASAEIKSALKFYMRSRILGPLESCFKGHDKPGAILACKDLCSRFNPVKFDQYFEGDMDKLDGFARFVTGRLKKMNEKFERHLAQEEANEAAVSPSRRLMDKRALSEEDAANKGPAIQPSPITHLDEGISEVSYFNRNFKAGLVPPIVYDFKSDYKIKFSKGIHESIFETGTESMYTLVNFQNVVSKDGIDFDYYGSVTNIEYDGAQMAFELLNKGNTTVTLEQFLKMMK